MRYLPELVVDVLQKLKFILVGVVNTLFGFIFFTLIYFLLENKVSQYLITIAANLISTAFSHFTQRKIVWRSTKPYLVELFRFSVGYAFILVLNLLLLFFATDVLKYPVLFSQYVIGSVLVVGMYLIQKIYIFKT